MYAWIAEGIEGADVDTFAKLDAHLDEPFEGEKAKAPGVARSRNTAGLLAAMGMKPA